MKILIFLQGTILMHRGGLGRTREERVRQVLDGEESVRGWASYIAVGGAAEKLQRWKGQGAEIAYLSAHKSAEAVRADKAVLKTCGFPDGPIYFRQTHEEYRDLAERIRPDILIEDDCESVGGEKEMTYPHIRPDFREKIKSIVVKEFGGIDHLPGEISELFSGS